MSNDYRVPQVGDIVHYWWSELDDDPLAAIVAGTYEDTRVVDLVVFERPSVLDNPYDNRSRGAPKVGHKDLIQARPRRGYWTWKGER